MNNKNDDPLEFDDEFDEGLDAEFDDDALDDFYDESLDENFETELAEDFPEGDDFAQDYDDQFDAEFDESQINPALMQENKKSGFKLSFNTIVIIGALIVGAGVLFMQVQKSQPTQGTAERFVSALNLKGADDGLFAEGATEQDQVSLSQNEDNVESNAIETSSQDEGFLFEPEILETMEVELNDVPPQPAPISEIVESEETTEVNIPNIEDVVLDAPSLLDEETVQVDNNDQQPRPPVEDVNEEQVVNIVEEASLIDNEIVESKPDEPIEIEPVEEKIVEVLQTENVEVAEPIVTEPVSQIVNVDMTAIERKLDQIVSRLDDMDVQMNQLQGSVDVKIETIQKELSSVDKQIDQLAKRPVAQTVAKKAPVVSNPKTATKPKVASVPVAKAPVWELRAAQPGKAWVSEKGTSEIKSIVVGDTLLGLGRVQNIVYQNGAWSVIGTQSTLRQ